MANRHRGKGFAFAVPPQIGDVVLWRNRVYTVAAVAPHKRRDSRDTCLLTWATICGTCAGPFQFTTGLAGRLDRVHCETCWRDARRQRLAILRKRRAQVRDGHALTPYRRKAR